jgi:hypothetical protein
MKLKQTLTATLLLGWGSTVGLGQGTLRPPAYPLVTHDPYFSVWSFNDQSNQYPTRHWSGADHPLEAHAKVDGKTYVLMLPSLEPYPLVPEGRVQAAAASYTASQPAEGWALPGFDDRAWAKGQTPFGHAHYPEAKTKWDSGAIWVRQVVDLPAEKLVNPRLHLRLVGEPSVVYLNGIQVFGAAGHAWRYQHYQLPPQALETLKPGRNVLAIYLAKPGRHGYADVGLYDYRRPTELADLPLAQQTRVDVTATQTIYEFACGGVAVALKFASPLLPDNLEVLARPASYVTFTAKSSDGAPHQVALFFGASGLLATHDPVAPVSLATTRIAGQAATSLGTVAQPVLVRKGDDVRIDWGRLWLVGGQAQAGPARELRAAFVQGRAYVPTLAPLPAHEGGLATVFNLGAVQKLTVARYLVLGYDDGFSVQYFGQNLRPWWRRAAGQTAERMLALAYTQYAELLKKCNTLDRKMYQDALMSGGDKYAQLCQLAYRQAISAHKAVADPKGKLLFFSKENFSNGSIGTVDVTYPSAPLFLLYSPPLLRGMLEFIFAYSESGRWTKPFPAHDLGTYPLANGQTYPHDMPVEEAGNMLILTAALAEVEHHADYAKLHWPTLTVWAEYLKKEGFDPADQLCTDDFAGKLARNANLSVKAILGLAAYGKLAARLGQPQVAAEYGGLARQMARQWMELAQDGDHYALAFGAPNTWSQKYNLVWDNLLDLGVFPPEVVDRELKYYLGIQGKYGLPLDSRRAYTKSDWVLWTATLARTEDEFRQLYLPIYHFADETQSRVPLSDWHDTNTGLMVGFQARSVVGGYFIKILKTKLE